eukprot:scaffold74025_cov33-Phaeocystis_antarctica.AAC.2
MGLRGRAQDAEGRPWRAPLAPQTATAGAFGAGEASDEITAWSQLPALGSVPAPLEMCGSQSPPKRPATAASYQVSE